MKSKIMVLALSLILIATGCASHNLSTSIENSLGEQIYLKVNGKLFLKETKDNTILLLLRSQNSPQLYYDKALAIFSESPLPKLNINENDDYQIQIPQSRKVAIIYNLTKNQINIIGTSDQTDYISKIRTNASIAKVVTNTNYLGYGFSFMNGLWTSADIKSSRYKLPFNTLDYADFNNKTLRSALPSVESEPGDVSCAVGTCTSGGAGSSSCSIGEAPLEQSCSVTCVAGYYACCVSSSVRCYCCKN